jgi:hypothetical protein
MSYLPRPFHFPRLVETRMFFNERPVEITMVLNTNRGLLR